MQSLKDDHPVVHDLFQAGYHVVRRSDRYCGGLSIDLVIVHTSMCSGESCHTDSHWGPVYYESSEQHKELGKARQTHDIERYFQTVGDAEAMGSFCT